MEYKARKCETGLAATCAQTACMLGRMFMYKNTELKNHAVVWAWPELCIYVAIYIFWFVHGRTIFAFAQRQSRKRRIQVHTLFPCVKQHEPAV
jgi:hypothetical protein